MSIKTSNTDFKTRIRQQIEDPIMRKAVANAQQRIGANRQKMVDELGHWEEWRDRAAQIRDHVLSNLDAYLYQLSEKVTQNGEMVKEKVAHLMEVRPEYLIGADVSCLLNISGRLQREGQKVKVMHIAEVLMSR